MNLHFIYSETSHKGNVRQENEDSCQIAETANGTIFVVCDGMGGAAEGKKASSIAVASIVEFFNKEVHENSQIALYNSLAFANEQIYATAQMYPDYKGMGTTACIVLIQNENIYFAHVGDSRIYLLSDATLYQLTKDHSFVNQLLEQGTITVEESKNHPQKNRILKALGVHQKVEPSVSSQPLLAKEKDILIICSDGLNDMVADQEIKGIINADELLNQKTENLLNKALENGGKDNITIQTIQIQESPHSKTVCIDKTLYTENSELISLEEEKFFKKKRIKILAFILIPLFLLGVFLIATSKKEEPINIFENECIEPSNDTLEDTPSKNEELDDIEKKAQDVDSLAEEDTSQISDKKNKTTQKEKSKQILNVSDTKEIFDDENNKEKKQKVKKGETENSDQKIKGPTTSLIIKYKHDYFIIANKQDTMNNTYERVRQFMVNTNNTGQDITALICKINEKEKVLGFEVGDTVYLTKEAFIKSKANSNLSNKK